MTIYKAGDILQEAQPFALLLLEVRKKKNCDFCFKKLKEPKRCAVCRTMYYCSKECAIGDWKIGHKFKECQVLKDNDLRAMMQSLPAGVRSTHDPINFMTTIKFIIRLMLKKKLDPAYNETFKMADGTVLGFEDLPGHSGVEHMETPATLYELLNIVTTALATAGVHVTDDEVWNAYSKYSENSVGVSPYVFSYEDIPIGRAIYIFKDYQHSCCSNSDRMFEDNKLYIRAIRDFDTAIEPPTLCIVDVMAEKSERQEKLFKQYDIICECYRCERNIEYPKEEEIFADIKTLTRSKIVEKLRQYVEDTKKVHRGGRTLQVLCNTKVAYTMLKARDYAEANDFEKDMAKTAQVVFGPSGWLKVKQELEVDVILMQIELMKLSRRTL